jgi:hypothetical protein
MFHDHLWRTDLLGGILFIRMRPYMWGERDGIWRFQGSAHSETPRNE